MTANTPLTDFLDFMVQISLILALTHRKNGTNSILSSRCITSTQQGYKFVEKHSLPRVVVLDLLIG